VVSESYHVNVKTLEKVMERANKWANRHAVKFVPDKFE
jgi:hypothetical protein